MKRNSLVKLLSVIVGIMVIVASVVCLTTVNAADDFGTEADGITVANKTAMDSWTATEGLKNGDFSEGLKYWGPVDYYSGTTDASAKASDVVEIVTSGTESYAKFNGSLDYKNAGIQTTPITVPAAKVEAGDKLAVLYKGDANPSASSKTKIAVRLYQYNTADGKATIVDCAAGNLTVDTIDATWSMLNTTSGIVLANATESENYTFSVSITAIAKTCIALVDDVQIVKVKDDGFYTLDGLKLDENGKPIEGSGSAGDEGEDGSAPEVNDEDLILGGVTSLLPGTETEGITNPDNAGQYTANASGIHGTVMLGFNNADFEQGFKWWAGKQNYSVLNSMKLVEEEDNTYVQFDTSKLDKTYEGIATPDIAISSDKISVGDKLVLIYDVKGNTGRDYQVTLDQRNGGVRIAEGYSNDKVLATNGDWTTKVAAATNGGAIKERTAGSALGYADSDYYTVFVQLQNASVDATACFDNLILAIEKDGKYYDFDGTEITFGADEEEEGGSEGNQGGSEGDQGGSGSDDDDSSDTNKDAEKILMNNGADMPGTEAEGITGKYSNLHGSAVLGLNNGDFTEGFKWWAGKQAGGPTAVMDLKTEGTNKYVQFNADKLTSTWQGLTTPDIAISDQYVKEGDTLALIYDYKGTDFQVVMAQRNGGTGRMAEGNENNSTELAVNGEWTTAVAPIKNTVGARSEGTLVGCADTGYYTFYLFVENRAEVCDASFDNFRIAKVGTDGGYYDIYTGEKLVFKSTSTDSSNGGSTGTGNGNGSGTGNGTSATTGETLPIAPLAVAGLVLTASVVILRKKVR